MKRVLLAGLVVSGLVASQLVATVANAQSVTHEVQIGSPLPGNRNAESMRFLPDSLTVHQGDQIHFSSRGFHTATLLPVGQSVDTWLGANASDLDDPFSVFRADPDDGAGAIKQDPGTLLPNRDDCGPAAGGTTCDFDGNALLSSGVPLEGPLDLTVDVQVQPGNSFWIVCLIHTHMRMKVTVVSNSEPASDAADVAADKAAKIARDNDWAVAMDARMEKKQTKHKTAGGKTVWDVFQGVDNHWVAISETYPKKLNIKKGDTVRWHFDQIIYETHTATSFNGAAFQMEIFNLVCDTDGDAGPGPDEPADPQSPLPCQDMSQVEVDFERRIAEGAGNGKFGGGDLETSAISGSNTLNNFAPFDVQFTDKSGKQPFEFGCIFHGNAMINKIRVK